MSFAEALSNRTHPLVMGVLNITPDSFSDGGRHFHAGRAVESAQRMIADGASILDQWDFPPQVEDVSYGRGARFEWSAFITGGAEVRG